MDTGIKRICTLLIGIVIAHLVQAQIPLPTDLPQTHPRLMATGKDRVVLLEQISKEAWAKEVLEGIRKRIDPYVEKTVTQPDWLYSRLIMY